MERKKIHANQKPVSGVVLCLSGIQVAANLVIWQPLPSGLPPHEHLHLHHDPENYFIQPMLKLLFYVFLLLIFIQ